ncbi:hypothetical protein ANN_06963 [Periplaneta americana]|uniref:Uncharacterized protein n=1 Tax=Periplaneta americana TaxID=6978 RepID=A0ABQ8TGW5_PERAM|nr:hypothetical protein ANN_06963 [Periplaneta americana]
MMMSLHAADPSRGGSAVTVPNCNVPSNRYSSRFARGFIGKSQTSRDITTDKNGVSEDISHYSQYRKHWFKCLFVRKLSPEDDLKTSKWAHNRQVTNTECTLTLCDLNCGFLLTNSDVYYANQAFSAHLSRAVASRSKASCLGLALRNARWFESSWGKKFSHEISASVWDRCPPSIVMHLGSYDR